MSTFLQPTSWPEALRMRSEHTEAVVVAGGTDVCVDINFGRLHPALLLDVSRVPELRAVRRSDGWLRIGAALTYGRLLAEIAPDLPALAAAARTVGSPQIRNRGTIGGNLGTASPAGDCHPPLLASRALVEVASVAGSRLIPISEFFVSPKHHALAPDELIAGVRVPRAAGPQVFAKVGARTAMVIATCSFSLALDSLGRSVGTGVGSAGPVPLRAAEAESFLCDSLAARGLWDHPVALPPELITGFADRVAAAAQPIDDVRGTAAYRLHGLHVLAARALRWAWNEFRETA
jgi:CO/xanthine dehydrogenase FAD-binding subunit